MTRALLTCSPHFVDLAINEIRRDQPQVSLLQEIAPGFVLLQAPYSFDKLTGPWRHKPSIYLHHLFPVHSIVPLETCADFPTQIKQIALNVAPPDAIVQIRSAIEELPCTLIEIQRALNCAQDGCDLRAPKGRVLSMLISPAEIGFEVYTGVSWATQNLSPWAGGQMPVVEPVSNRAGYKLLEALATFELRLRKGDHALDLGASPGAWTTLLRRRGLRVTAVAPTPLYPWLAIDSGVLYQPIRAEEFLSRCETKFDLIVNDMVLDVQDSARLMVEYAQHLRHEGIAIMTLKLRSRNQARVMDHAFRLLRKAYKIIRVRQLVSNGEEVTLFLRRKS